MVPSVATTTACDVLLLDHAAIIFKEACLREAGTHGRRSIGIDVAQGDDLGQAGVDDLVEVRTPFARDADQADADTLRRGWQPLTGGRGVDEERRRSRDVADAWRKSPTVKPFWS